MNCTTDRLYSQGIITLSASLDTAWQEAEAALPEGTALWLDRDEDGTYTAEAQRPHALDSEGRWSGGIFLEEKAATAAECLHALALALRAGATS